MTQNDERLSLAEGELRELRAALMHTLRLAPRTEPGSDGLTILSPPPDHELLAEVGRLRSQLDALAGQEPTTGSEGDGKGH